MAVTTADVYGAAIEKVSNKLQKYFEQTDQIAGLIKKTSEVETIGRRLFRFAAMQFMGGSYQKFNPNSGSMGSGTGMKLGSFTSGYIPTTYVVEISEDTIETTNKPGQSVVNVFAKQLSGAMDEIKAMDDIGFHGDGTAKLTNPASATSTWTGGTTYTFANTTDTIGVGKLREGMSVSVWIYSGASVVDTKYSAQIDHIDYNNKVVYLNATVSGAAGNTSGTGDLLAFAEAEASVLAAPLASFSSSWPGTPSTAGVLTGDSFRHGYLYANDSTTTNYFLGTIKSANTQLIPATFAASSSLTFAMGQLLLDGLLQRRDPEIINGLIGIANFAQKAAYTALQVNVMNIYRDAGKPAGNTDLQPTGNDYTTTFDFCGIKTYLSKRQHKDRLDFINPATWGRAQLYDTKFHEVGGKKIFESRNSSGALIGAQHFIVKQAYDFVPFDPGSGAYLSALSVPSGY
jgi:hypothetical protein